MVSHCPTSTRPEPAQQPDSATAAPDQTSRPAKPQQPRPDQQTSKATAELGLTDLSCIGRAASNLARTNGPDLDLKAKSTENLLSASVQPNGMSPESAAKTVQPSTLHSNTVMTAELSLTDLSCIGRAASNLARTNGPDLDLKAKSTENLLSASVQPNGMSPESAAKTVQPSTLPQLEDDSACPGEMAYMDDSGRKMHECSRELLACEVIVTLGMQREEEKK